MFYHSIPDTDLKLSAIGLGTWVFGGGVWGTVSEKESLAAVDSALENGINFIDTAPIYGNGQSERIVGKAIQGRREKVILATKCGIAMQGKRAVINLSADSIRREIEDSLRRLQVDYVDLYQCHWPDPNTPLEWTMEALNKLKEEQKIRYIGVCNFPAALLKRSLEITEIVSLQSQYSILQRSLEEEILAYCKQKGIGIFTYGVLGGGILSGKYAKEPQFKGADARSFFYKYYQGENFKKTERVLKELSEIPKPLSQTAINWVRQNPAVTTVLVGCRNAEQVKENVKAVEWDLTPEQIQEINGIKFNGNG